MRTFLWVFMNILKKIDFFRAFEKMLKNLTFWTSPKLESLVQSTWGYFCNGFRICFFRKKYFQTDCDLEKKWPFDSLRQPILRYNRKKTHQFKKVQWPFASKSGERIDETFLYIELCVINYNTVPGNIPFLQKC